MFVLSYTCEDIFDYAVKNLSSKITSKLKPAEGLVALCFSPCNQ